MKKFLAVVKREYIQRVRAKMFIVSTVLLPAVMSLFGIVPAIILSINSGAPMRVAIVDQTGKMYPHLNQALLNETSQEGSPQTQRTSGGRGFGNFVLQEVKTSDQPVEQVRTDLDRRLGEKEIDGYVILPPDFLEHGQAEFFNRNPGDVVSRRLLQSSLNRAVE